MHWGAIDAFDAALLFSFVHFAAAQISVAKSHLVAEGSVAGGWWIAYSDFDEGSTVTFCQTEISAKPSMQGFGVFCFGVCDFMNGAAIDFVDTSISAVMSDVSGFYTAAVFLNGRVTDGSVISFSNCDISVHSYTSTPSSAVAMPGDALVFYGGLSIQNGGAIIMRGGTIDARSQHNVPFLVNMQVVSLREGATGDGLAIVMDGVTCIHSSAAGPPVGVKIATMGNGDGTVTDQLAISFSNSNIYLFNTGADDDVLFWDLQVTDDAVSTALHWLNSGYAYELGPPPSLGAAVSPIAAVPLTALPPYCPPSDC